MRVPILLTVTALAIASLAPAQMLEQIKNPANLGPDMPTPQAVVDEMLRVAKVMPGETVYDLGCGDGRILITAVQKYNARAVGVELSRDIFERTTAHIKSMGLADKILIIHGDALHVDLTPADVVTLYLLTSSNDRLKPTLARLRPGARVVSHDYEVRGWKPVGVTRIQTMGTIHTVYLYQMKPKS